MRRRMSYSRSAASPTVGEGRKREAPVHILIQSEPRTSHCGNAVGDEGGRHERKTKEEGVCGRVQPAARSPHAPNAERTRVRASRVQPAADACPQQGSTTTTRVRTQVMPHARATTHIVHIIVVMTHMQYVIPHARATTSLGPPSPPQTHMPCVMPHARAADVVAAIH